MRLASACFCVLVLLSSAASWSAPLAISVRGQAINYGIFSIFSSPGETVSLGLAAYDSRNLQLYLDGRAYGQAGDGVWNLTTPLTPGLYKLQLNHQISGDRTVLNLFVGVSADKLSDGYLEGYRIGSKPPGDKRYPARYRAPDRFYRVSEDMLDVQLSPHFRLRQFLCKQASDFPKYVVLSEPLLVLLEAVLAETRSRGYDIETFGIISGYRTPFYNASIGNVANSRHVYGDALDFFIDQNKDGLMDDLNRDGQRNRADVDLLFKLVEDVKAKTDNALLVGGVGRYYRASHHGGFVHVDTRGHRARW
ncbi:MAG: D-Ala-D-Ala carboxypeptidase family metallohydrolase [Halieaceae bacterium]